METVITYNVCRQNLGDDTTDAQYCAYKNLIEQEIKNSFGDSEKYGNIRFVVGDSDFCNESTCEINIKNHDEKFEYITRNDVDEAVSNIDESWWDAE